MIVLTILQIIFLTLKCFDLVPWSWFITFTPLLSFIILLVTTLLCGWIAVIIEEWRES